MSADSFSVAYRPPFQFGSLAVSHHEYGATIAELIAATPDLPDDFGRRGVVMINGEEMERRHWHRIRPRSGTNDRPIMVTLHYPPRGGGGQSSGKQAASIIGALALTIATAGIASGALGTAIGGAALGLIGPGTAGATILAAGVPLDGSIAAGMLTELTA
ncbi:hypothetical protein [Ancylobacter terrae]|uniref:hypothetical protein n=1 Tax=Ancylobacter sp. sgz301288 TaxID=3342077 RepID=UPI00385C6D22